MRSVAIRLVLLAAIVGAFPTRFTREEIAAPLEPAKSVSSSLLELPEPGPFGDTELVDDAPAPTKAVETADALPETLVEEVSTKKTTTPGEESEESGEVTTTTTSSLFSELFVPSQPIVEVCNEENAKGRSKIYCSGRLLEAVNLNHLFPDSKTFVDRPMKVNRTQDEIMADFNARFPDDDIDPEQLRSFVEEHFEQEGHELDICNSPDWTPAPIAFEGIKDEKMKEFAHSLNDIWKELCRKMKPMVSEEQHRFSLINVSNAFIAPGGRFREFYYWDTYWIVKGLLASGMFETTRGMLENFGQIIYKYGFIPNGGRVYYLKRSQPPLLTAMVYEYYEATRNKTFLEQMMPHLEDELRWWQNNRNLTVEIDGVKHTMYQYRTEANVPRPESYREDYLNALNMPSMGHKQVFYRNLGSAAESGWDFSTRWFKDHKTLVEIETTKIVPVDLNAFICYNFNLLSFFYGELGNRNDSRSKLNDYNAFKASFKSVFYKPEARGWYDFNLRSQQHNLDFFPSIAVPLFTGCYDQLSLTQSTDLLEQMEELGALSLAAGIPTSMANHTQEQWDYPNGWSPLNHMVIEGMRKSENPRLQQAAFELAQKWVNGNLHVYNLDNAMWEKYNVKTNEARGGGGEYEVQAGFGWTNGVVLDLLVTYGDRLRFTDPGTPSSSSPKLESSTPPTMGSPMPIVSDRTTTTSSVSSTSLFPVLVIGIVALITRW